jgi:surfeit locus 1 family protein
MPINFRFRWIPFIATVIVCTIGVLLAQWQTRRAEQKEAIEAKIKVRETAPPLSVGASPVSVDEVEYRRVQVKGKFIQDWPVYLENRPYRGVSGFYVLMPLAISGTSSHVMIERGWIARDPVDRAKLPPIATPKDTVEIEGIAVRNPDRLLQLGQANPIQPHAILQNLDVAAFAAVSKMPMQGFVIEQLSDSHDGLVRDWPRPSAGSERHRGYEFQWYALSAMALIFFVVIGFRRGTK